MGMKGIIIVNAVAGIETVSNLNINSLNIYPNPSSRNFIIDFTINQKANIEISLIDFTGNTVKKIVSQEQTPGHYTLNVENKNLYGSYFVRLIENKKNVITKKIVVL